LYVELVRVKSRHIDIDACIENHSEADHQSTTTKYSSVDFHDFNKPLPYDSASYRLIVCLFPPTKIGPYTPTFQEISRVLEEDGYALIGATDTTWRKYDMIDNLQKVEECTLLSAMDLNCAKTPLKEPYHLAVLAKKTFD
jgi:hypothetical protein